jgi:hypothetical protein
MKQNRDKISRISDMPRDDWGLITGATPVVAVRLSISEVLSIVVLLPISLLVSTFVCLVKVGGLEPEHRGSSPGSDRTVGCNVHVDTGPTKSPVKSIQRTTVCRQSSRSVTLTTRLHRGSRSLRDIIVNFCSKMSYGFDVERKHDCE